MDFYGLKEEYESIWDAYQVSEEEKDDQIKMNDTEIITKDALWDVNKIDLEYQQARQRLTETVVNNLPKGIGVTEMATEFSFYAPYQNTQGTKTWGWFKTVDQAVAGTQERVTTWDRDLVYIGHAHLPFVARGGHCDSGFGDGVLSTGIADGGAISHSGFRPVVVL